MRNATLATENFQVTGLLMNHRKTDHPSNKKCRYFLNDQCRFDAETCWYRHEDEQKNEERKQSSQLQCKECDDKFEVRSDLMKHKKMNHPDKVSKCKEFSQGKCNEGESSCWFNHNTEEKETEEMEIDLELNESFFCEAKEKTPPDQMISIMMMIKKLSFQVEKLERNSKKIQ